MGCIFNGTFEYYSEAYLSAKPLKMWFVNLSAVYNLTCGLANAGEVTAVCYAAITQNHCHVSISALSAAAVLAHLWCVPLILKLVAHQVGHRSFLSLKKTIQNVEYGINELF